MAPVTVGESATFMIYCRKKDPHGYVYCISVRDGKLVLALPNMGDYSQMWEKEDMGNGNFMLVSKYTYEVVKFYDKGDQLTMVSKPLNVDTSVLWAEGTQDYEGYTCVKAPALLDMVMDAWTGNIHVGTVISINTPSNPKSPNQLWKLTPILGESATFMIYCKKRDSKGNVYCIAVRDGKLALAYSNRDDLSQMWEKEDMGNGYFMLVSKYTYEVVKFYGKGDQLTMVSKPLNVDTSVLWAEGTQDNDGYACITAPALLDMVMDAWTGDIHVDTVISIYTQSNPASPNQLWKLNPI